MTQNQMPNEGGGAWSSECQQQRRPSNLDEGPLPQVESGEEQLQYSDQPMEGAETYTVEDGDTLQTIAARFYGSATEWERIYHANEDKLSGNPELLYPGQELRIPAS